MDGGILCVVLLLLLLPLLLLDKHHHIRPDLENKQCLTSTQADNLRQMTGPAMHRSAGSCIAASRCIMDVDAHGESERGEKERHMEKKATLDPRILGLEA